MKKTIEILSALAEPTRYQVLRLLWDRRERCVCELMETLGKSQSCLSRHMGQLKRAGLVTDRRDAQWVRYRRNPELSRSVLRLVDAALGMQETSSKRKRT